MIDVKLDTSDVLAVRAMLSGIKGGANRAIGQAINKTLTGGRTDATNELTEELNLTKTRVRKDFKVYKAYWSGGNPVGSLVSSGKPVGLASFQRTRQTKKGVSVQVKKRRPRKVLRHAFIATANKSKNVFWRKKQKGVPRKPARKGLVYAKLPRKFRYPILRLKGPRIQDIYAKTEVMSPVIRKIDVRLKKNLSYEVQRILTQ